MYLSLVILQDTGLYVRVEFVCHSGPGHPRNKRERDCPVLSYYKKTL